MGFASVVSARAGGKAAAAESGDAIEIRAGNLKINISKQTGFLTDVRRGAQSFSLEQRAASGGRTRDLDQLETLEQRTGLHRDRNVCGGLEERHLARARRRLGASVIMFYTANGPMDFHGVAFDYPEQLVLHKKWLGDGPYRVWKNRLPGATLDVWENDYNNTITGWSDWVYPEFKGCFADVRWLQLETSEGAITAVPANGPFVQVLTPELRRRWTFMGRPAYRCRRPGWHFCKPSRRWAANSRKRARPGRMGKPILQPGNMPDRSVSTLARCSEPRRRPNIERPCKLAAVVWPGAAFCGSQTQRAAGERHHNSESAELNSYSPEPTA